MTTNIVTAVFGAFRVTRTRPLYQYDYGQILRFKDIKLPDAYTVHFSNQQIGGEAVKQVGNADGVLIPDAMLTSGQNVYAWVFLHTGADDGETRYEVTIPVQRKSRATEEAPTPVQHGLVDQAIAALNAGVEAAQEAAESVQDMGVEAETLAPGSAATVEKTVDPETGVVTLEFGIPRGAQGVPGQDGVSPTATVTQTSTGATISITDVEGTTTAEIANGKDGDPGAPGFSPTVTVTDITGGHRVTITDAEGTHTFDVLNGTDGEDGRGIASAVLNADYTLTLTYTDGTSYTTPSIRGAKGDPGEVTQAEFDELKSAIANIDTDYYAEVSSGSTAYPYTVTQGNIGGDGTIVPDTAYAMYSSVFTTADLIKLTVNVHRESVYICSYDSPDGDKDHFKQRLKLLAGNEITNTWSYPYFRINVSVYGGSPATINETEFRTTITATTAGSGNVRKGFVAPVENNAINWGVNGQIVKTDGNGGVIYDDDFRQSRWAGKTILTFGDSITYYDGNTYGQYHKQYGQTAVGYQSWMRTKLGCTVTNKGESGYSMPQILGVIKQTSFSSVDCVTITSGANDYADIVLGSETLGSIQPIGSTFDETSFYGAMQSAIEYIYAQNVETNIILITPIKGWFAGVVMPDDYAEAIKEIGALYSIPVCDWYSESGINSITMSAYIGDVDGSSKFLHPNDTGYEMMANVLIPFLANH